MSDHAPPQGTPPRWPGGRLYFMAPPFHSSGKEFEIVVERQEEAPDANFMFALPEYESAFRDVLQYAVEGLTRQKSPVLRSIEDRRTDVVRTTHVTSPSGDVVSNPPLRVAMGYRFSLYDVIDFNLKAFAKTCDLAAEELTDARINHLLDFHGRICEAFGNVGDAGGRPFGWPTILLGLEGVAIGFDSSGEPILPKIIAEKDKRNFVDYPEMSDDDRKMFDELIERKRKESNA